MSTQPETVEFIIEKLGHEGRFRTHAMFGEYALYADEKVVGLVCNDQLYVKILPESAVLADLCEQDTPYPKAKPHYIIEEGQYDQIEDLPEILFKISESLPSPKLKKKKK